MAENKSAGFLRTLPVFSGLKFKILGFATLVALMLAMAPAGQAIQLTSSQRCDYVLDILEHRKNAQRLFRIETEDDSSVPDIDSVYQYAMVRFLTREWQAVEACLAEHASVNPSTHLQSASDKDLPDLFADGEVSRSKLNHYRAGLQTSRMNALNHAMVEVCDDHTDCVFVPSDRVGQPGTYLVDEKIRAWSGQVITELREEYPLNPEQVAGLENAIQLALVERASALSDRSDLAQIDINDVQAHVDPSDTRLQEMLEHLQVLRSTLIIVLARNPVVVHELYEP